MKNNLKLAWIGIVMMFSVSFAQAQDKNNRIWIPTYHIDTQQAKVYFGHDEMTEVDIQTFTELNGDHFAKDKNHVYSGKHILAGLDPAQTVSLGYNTLKDNRYVYQGDKQIIDADPLTYQLLVANGNRSYSKDKNAVYYGSQKMPLMDQETIAPLSPHYAKDKNHIYYDGSIIPQADPDSFNPINYPPQYEPYDQLLKGYGYAQDNHHIYYNDQVIDGADLTTFKETTYGYAEDKNRVYYLGKIVENADPKTFVQPPYKPVVYRSE